VKTAVILMPKMISNQQRMHHWTNPEHSCPLPLLSFVVACT
jgi:hypothetical protein